MIYQVTAVMLFTRHDEAVDFFHDCELALPKATVIHPGEANQECSYSNFIHCRHDQVPGGSCDLAQHIDNCPVP